ncbi:hypothetical protein OPAG_05198 [Rhodococcus opacus PD630]|nr:Zn-ribbon domain-containing OB-fold protein [Rhodococcus opacus]EHI45165.1 hypothetical protein OPAG_05198 [Rhodococcus opacus PD630]RZK71924.1 MAG: Zn-ribbon domain-containing OB-fold protein [Rhodococcus sp. (in: high G+C Gram-positive bacteria)]UDG94353.1 Zn-ribbon domain-containing OB-fold protein [Rhodococcus opacus PD630]
MPVKDTPIPTPVTQPYWDALDRHELMIQRCAHCSAANFYPRLACPSCGSRRIDWVRASGRASLHSYVINHVPAPGFEDEAPYVIAIVQLEEGPRMMTNLRKVAAEPEALPLDLPLEVTFEARNGRTLPMFQPVGSAA